MLNTLLVYNTTMYVPRSHLSLFAIVGVSLTNSWAYEWSSLVVQKRIFNTIYHFVKRESYINMYYTSRNYSLHFIMKITCIILMRSYLNDFASLSLRLVSYFKKIRSNSYAKCWVQVWLTKWMWFDGCNQPYPPQFIDTVSSQNYYIACR